MYVASLCAVRYVLLVVGCMMFCLLFVGCRLLSVGYVCRLLVVPCLSYVGRFLLLVV